MKSRRLGTVLGIVSVAAALLLTAGPAAAATTTIGQLAPSPSTAEYHEGSYGPPPYYTYYPPYYTYSYSPPTALCSTAQDYLQASAGYVVPANGEKITAWRTNATTGAGQEMTLKVFRKVGDPATYEVIGQDGPRTLTPAPSATGKGQLNAFTGLSIPVQPGDVIGLYPVNAGTVHDACMFASGGEYMSSATNLGTGASAPFTAASGDVLNVTADVLLTPGSGSPTQHTLTATVAGGGYGTVQSSPAGIEACSSTCSHPFDDGTAVTLTASPDGYSTFAGWSGGGCSGQATCQVTIGADTTVTATFNVNTGGAYGSGYEYPSGSYGTPGGENAGGKPGATVKCKKRSAGKAGRKAHCVRKSRLVAKRVHNASLGKEILTAKNGHTLYSLSAEGGGKFICTAGCLSIWHPLTVPAGVLPTGPVKLGVVTRPEGGIQVTYHGRPLYTFAEDTAPGETNGQGIKDVGTWGAVVVPPPKH